MEFMSRGRPVPTPAPQHSPVHHQPAPSKKGLDRVTSAIRLEMFVVIIATVIVTALAVWLFAGSYSSAEAEQVNEKQYQAVFLTNNQVYFGKITDINKSSIILTDVFYIETPNQGQSGTDVRNTNYTLRKLGSNELHSPEDKMVINREQVTFWENLKDSGQVVTKIKEYKQNPDAANQNAPSSNQSEAPPVSPPSADTPTTENP